MAASSGRARIAKERRPDWAALFIFGSTTAVGAADQQDWHVMEINVFALKVKLSRFDRAYFAQLTLIDIYRIEPTEPQRRAAEDWLGGLLAERYRTGFYDGRSGADE